MNVAIARMEVIMAKIKYSLLFSLAKTTMFKVVATVLITSKVLLNKVFVDMSVSLFI